MTPGADDLGRADDLERLARSLARRATTTRFVAALSLVLVQAAVIALVLGLSRAAVGIVLGEHDFARALELATFAVVLGAAPLGVLAGLACALTPRVRPFDAALDADRRHGLADRFASALELAAGRGTGDIRMIEAAIDDARSRTRVLDPARLYPFGSARRLLVAFVLFAILLASRAIDLAAWPASDAEEAAQLPGVAANPGGQSGEGRGSGASGDGDHPGDSSEAGGPDAGRDEPGPGEEEGTLPDGTGETPPAEPQGSEGAHEPTNPGERPGATLFGEAERAPAQRERIDLPSLFSAGDPVTREALVQGTSPGEGGVPGPGKEKLTPELHREFERLAEEEIQSPRLTEKDRDLVRRYFDRIRPRAAGG